jgi:hypothetical protein
LRKSVRLDLLRIAVLPAIERGLSGYGRREGEHFGRFLALPCVNQAADQ